MNKEVDQSQDADPEQEDKEMKTSIDALRPADVVAGLCLIVFLAASVLALV